MAKKGLLLLLLVAVCLFFYGDLNRHLTLESLKESYQTLATLRADAPLWVASLFFALYVLITALSLPGLTLMMLAAGALFDLWLGTLLVSFAASIGATSSFLLARYLLRTPIQNRFAAQLDVVNRGMDREGVSYLLTLRLLPIFPSFLVNLLMGLTTLPVRTFYWVSQVGMLAATLIYVQAGTRLAQLQHPADILSVELLCTLSLLAVLPLLVLHLRKKTVPDTLS